MNSLASRLTAVFVTVTFGAILIVYLGVVPQLDGGLVRERASGLRAAAARLSPRIAAAINSGAPVATVDGAVRRAADASAARVTLLGVNRGSFGPQPFPKSDSYAGIDTGELDFEAATAAIASGHPESATEAGRDGRVVEAARPLWFRDPDSGEQVVGSVLVFTTSLRDVEHTVAVVRRRIIGAGAIALLAAMLAGWIVARRLGRRATRLEEVARRVADGDFSARFPLDRDDELGRLGRALDAMQRQLAELDTSRRRFIATASHELRTPIFSISGFLELLESEDLDEETRTRFLTQIRGQVGRLGRLAGDLLDLSRLESGTVELHREDTDVGALARTVAREFEPALRAHDSTLTFSAEAPVHGSCDPDRVGQILRALLDNAVTHTPAGTPIALALSGSGSACSFTISDGGPGIPRDELPAVFEPFSTSNGRTGSGLGLAIARELAGLMDGQLTVASSSGGSTFTLTFPLGVSDRGR